MGVMLFSYPDCRVTRGLITFAARYQHAVAGRFARRMSVAAPGLCDPWGTRNLSASHMYVLSKCPS